MSVERTGRAWLVYDEELNAIFCSVCKSAKTNNIFAKPGGYTGGPTKKLVLSQIKKHGDSEKHKEAVLRTANASAMQLMLDNARVLEEKRTENQLPYELMPQLCCLVKDSIDIFNAADSFDRSVHAYGSSGNAKSAADLVSVCETSVMQTTKMEIDAAMYFSVTCDESTDGGGEKNLIVMARYVYGSAIRVRMLGVVTPGTSDAVLAALLRLIEDVGLDYRDMVGFASDGASVMLGCRNGVATLLKTKIPRLVTSHCPAHRLNVAAEAAEGPYEEERMSVVTAIYSYFNKSLSRQQALDAAIQHCKSKNPKPLLGWLSRGQMMSNFYELLDPIAHVIHEDKGSAASVHAVYLANDGFHFWVALMNDILVILNNLSKALQASDMHIVMVGQAVATHAAHLKAAFPAGTSRSSVMTPSACSVLGKLEQKATVDYEALDEAYEASVNYVERLVEGLEERFTTRTQEVVESFSALYPFGLKKAESLGPFGNEAVINLAKLYDLDVPSRWTNVLLLEHYVTTMAPQLDEANYVGHRLPPVLVAAVDSYVFAPRPSIMDMLPDTAANIISVIAVGLASAAVCQPSLPLPSKAIDRILRAVTDPDLDSYSMRRIRVDGIQSVLYLALATNRVDAALFEQCVILWDLKLLPALRTLCATQCPNFSTVSPFVIAYLRRVPKSLGTPDCWRSSWYTDDEKIYKDASVAIGVLLLLDAIDLLQRLSPTTVVPYLTACLAALPRTLEATHSLLAPVVMHGPRVKVLWHLASQLIARFEALPSLPTYASFAIVHKFLQSPDDAEFILYQYDLCDMIARVINAHSTRLAFLAK
ncbi:hypothetical protein SPRG_14850 [Saprolegnia parasitica CBS 223.65]|uniref:C17orf113 probable zinc finger domain-containing protein n=1 Tax=Saprolegnia parasitica (strain CBS 223.65) TaxID=695850 RepID=A0A067BLC3_SAPPC|nr:hypothetical protein SPRG_14850 [Saprolegnia parasitica CBS 223.65]KDO19013.1 hypothetical protein SPRG_14850 [Saprolegnia parasitica CBS 223.65]|eukprot:XP_012210268.1 hypothetical protein SPRG_14850 [Saprolegnia parasitica CBS 223.65]